MITLAEVKEWNAYHLADSDRADCMSPDRSDSPGAAMLLRVRDDVVELVESWRADNPDAPWADLDDALADDLAQVADDAPSIYTHDRWAQFVDLGAYQEEPDITGEWSKDLTESAGWALYQIADRLARVLVRELSEQDDDEDGE